MPKTLREFCSQLLEKQKGEYPKNRLDRPVTMNKNPNHWKDMAKGKDGKNNDLAQKHFGTDTTKTSEVKDQSLYLHHYSMNGQKGGYS